MGKFKSNGLFDLGNSEKKVYSGCRHKITEAELRHKLLVSWDEIDLDVIRKSIASWEKRLRMVYKKH